MQLNLPILHLLENSQNILIAGAGGGFDVFAGLPLFFTLRDLGKTVHLANYSFTPHQLAPHFSDVTEEIPDILYAVKGALQRDMYYYSEGYLSDWFVKQNDEQSIWLMPNLGVGELYEAYECLIKKLNIDALILVDGGVDSIARGDEQGPGSMLEDTISLLAIEGLSVPVKILATIGFGTEVEEAVDHYAALENMAGIIKAGGFYGSCSLVPTMKAFALYESACRHAWEGNNRALSHISTRIIPAVHGEFGDYRMYTEERTKVFISPLMSIYWFYDANIVLQRNLAASGARGTRTKDQARSGMLKFIGSYPHRRYHKTIPY